MFVPLIRKGPREGSTPNLLGEGSRVRAHAQIGFHRRFVDVLQTVPISMHDQTCVIVEENANTVVTELVT